MRSTTRTTTARCRLTTQVRSVTAGTLGIGVTVHAIALALGRDWLLEHVLTPAVDVALVIPMAFSAWGLWHLRHHVQHPRRTHKVLFTFLWAYLGISALVHVETAVVGEVRYVARFPHWYSALILPVQASLVAFTARLRFDARAPADT